MSILVDFDFLRWATDVIFFRDDFERDLIALGATKEEAFSISRSESFKSGDLIRLYRYQFMLLNEELFDKYMRYLYDKYDTYLSIVAKVA
jgi:hypothetical protein